MEKNEVKIVEGVTPLAVPAPSFWASQAMTEFGTAIPGWISNTMRSAGVALPGHMSNLAGRSAGDVFSMYIGRWNPDYYDTEYGWTANQSGSMNPAYFKGIYLRGLYVGDYDSSGLMIWFDGNMPAFNLTIDGAGTVYVPANVGSSPYRISWPGIYDWIGNRYGSTITGKLSY